MGREAAAAVCELDKNTAGGPAEEAHGSHTQKATSEQDVNMLSLFGDQPCSALKVLLEVLH